MSQTATLDCQSHRVDRLGSRPAVPILLIIPARSADQTLHACLAALHASRCRYPFEILVVRDGLAEEPINATARQTRSPVARSAATARNHGASELRQGVFVFLDSDVLVNESTIESLLGPILAGEAEATVGNYSTDVSGLTFLQSYKQLHIATVYGRRRGYIKSEFWTAIGAVRADVFHQLGGFNAAFRGACGEDTELGQRLTAGGYRIMAVPEATGRHLHRFTLATLLLNDLRKGTQTALQTLQHSNHLSDNRHSAPPEVLAVFCAALFPAFLLAGCLTPKAVLFGAASAGFAAWVFARRDQLRVFARRGWFFLIRAVILAVLLDWVRCLCVAKALLRYMCLSHGSLCSRHVARNSH